MFLEKKQTGLSGHMHSVTFYTRWTHAESSPVVTSKNQNNYTTEVKAAYIWELMSDYL